MVCQSIRQIDGLKGPMLPCASCETLRRVPRERRDRMRRRAHRYRTRRRRRSEEHTSELQSLAYLVCRLLLEKKERKIKPVPDAWCSKSSCVRLRSDSCKKCSAIACSLTQPDCLIHDSEPGTALRKALLRLPR